MAAQRPRLDVRAVTRLTELADYITPFAIRVVCDLRLADELADGPVPVTELAGRLGVHAESLTRVLRALAGSGIFAETGPGVFGLTPLAQPLRTDHPFSVQACFPLMPPDIGAWARLTGSIRTGEISFDRLYGAHYYDHMADRPYECDRFERSAESVNPLVLRTVAPLVDLAGVGHLVDVGGGHGTFLAGLLVRHPAVRATLFDLPHVAALAPEVLAAAGVADRCAVVGGDMFDQVPAGGDAYLLKTILHDWEDGAAARVLAQVRSAISPAGRLVVIESVRRPGNEHDVGKVMDVKALALFGGHTRTEEEFGKLFAGAGFRLDTVTDTPTMSIIVGTPN